MPDLIKIDHLRKDYGSFQLRDVSFTVPEGCIMGLIGENGAGKTTVIKLLLNILRRDGGTVTIFGKDNLASEREIKEETGVVFDECYFHGDLFPADLGKILSAAYRSWDGGLYRRLLDDFEIPVKKSVKELSKGMKMKLQIAGALSHHPRLLILDEATSGLDPVVRSEILDLLLDFIQEEGNSALFSSHITSDLEHVADYITFLHRGELVFSRSKDDLIYQYGIARCGASEFEKLDRRHVIRYRKSGYGVEALVSHREAVRRSRPDLVVDRATLEDIMVLYSKGDRL